MRPYDAVWKICGCGHVLGHCVVEAHEVRPGDHHQITTLSKMGPIFEFFGENIDDIDGAWDVEDADFAFVEIDVFDSFVGK